VGETVGVGVEGGGDGDLFVERGAEPTWPGMAVDLIDRVNAHSGCREGVDGDDQAAPERAWQSGNGDPGEEDVDAECAEVIVVGRGEAQDGTEEGLDCQGGQRDGKEGAAGRSAGEQGGMGIGGARSGGRAGTVAATQQEMPGGQCDADPDQWDGNGR